MTKLSVRTIQRLGKHVTGDSRLTPYRSGPNLVSLFNQFGCNDRYPMGGGFPSRWVFAENKLDELNGTPEILALIEAVFDPLEFKDKDELDADRAISDINDYLRRDDLQIVHTNSGVKVRPLGTNVVAFEQAVATLTPASEEFVAEHVSKCESKLLSGDNRGAVTNARSLCEQVLTDIERQLDANANDYDGDLPRLFKRVRKLLNMDPEKYKEREDISQILRGLTSIVDGLASVSNDLGDRHGGSTTRTKPHHAYLAVNVANSFCTFMLASFREQQAAKQAKSP